MSQNLFVFGMFRSGTTLLARMLHTHPQIACASDPYRPFFNSFRDSIAEDLDVSTDPYDPLGSYFADHNELDLFDAIQSASLDRQFDRDRSELLERIKSHGQPFSPKIIDNLDSLPGETFKEVYTHLLDQVPEYYGTGSEKWIATKEVWSTEFVPSLYEAFPDSKFLLVVRDPRAVAASNNADENQKYPWSFLARQWRKLAILTWVYNSHPPLRDQVHIVKYEELVQSPQETAENICDFLNITLDEQILDPSNFVDGRGEQWLQNTTYGEGGASFNTDSVDKWEKVLDPKTVELLEQFCYLEMQQFDYSFKQSDGYRINDDLLLNPPVVTPDEMADWISNYYKGRSQESIQSELGQEHIRQRMSKCTMNVRNELSVETIRMYYLNKEFFEVVHNDSEQ